MSDATKAVITTSITAGATLTVAILSLLAAYLAGKRERRRSLYSEAVRAAVAWRELLYRVRRRRAGQESELISAFHSAQDQLAYYQAWVGSDSRLMKRSYDRLVREVKAQTEDLIRSAWADPVRPIPGNAVDTDEHPDLSAAIDTFLKDVRSHLSPWPWRKLAVVGRNRRGS